MSSQSRPSTRPSGPAQDERGRTVLSLAMAAVVMFAAGTAFAAGGGHEINLHPEINWWSWDAESPPVGWFLVNFVIFVFLLVRLAGNKVNAAFASRSNAIRENVETNERELNDAQDERDEWKDKLAGVGSEASELIENAKSDGERDKEKIVHGAEEYAERLRADTGTIMEQEAANAQRELQLEVSLQALDKAEALLRGSITDHDRTRLFDLAVSQLADGKSEVAPVAGESALLGGAP